MANWCSNWVTVEGKEANIKSLMDEIRVLEIEAAETDSGVRPDEEGDLRYMFSIYVNDDDSFSFESKWSPANDSLNFLAKKYEVTITNRYEESAARLYGEWMGNEETEDDTYLTNEEWDSIFPGNEDCNFYIYNGKEYETEGEVLDLILDEKIKRYDWKR